MAHKLAQEFTLLKLIRFTLPSTIMMIFMALYQMVDGVFVSNFVGADALSALNLVYPVISIVIAVAIMLATGGTAIIARQMGQGDHHSARQNFTFICLTGLGAGLLFVILGLLFAKPIVLALGATPEIYEYCFTYLNIMALTCPLAIFQMLFQTFFVAAGKPNLGLLVTIAGGLFNIALDTLFVGVLDFGVAGAAWATAAGYAVPAIFGLFYFALKRKGALYFVRPRFDFKILLQTCGNGSSEMVTNLAGALTTYLFNTMMLSLMGPKGVAAITIILYSQFLLTAVFMGFSIGVAPVFSFNYGRKNRTETHRVFRLSLWFVGVCSVIALLISYLFGNSIVGIFARPGTEVFALASQGFPLFAIGFAFAGINIFSSAVFTAFSNGLVSALISFSRTFVFIVACLLILPQFLGVTGIFLAIPVAEVFSFVFSLICFIRYRSRYGY